MTQTITKANTIPTGTMYPVEHLRTAESIAQICEYVDAGHPLAWLDGGECRLLQRRVGGFNAYRLLKQGAWQHQTIREETLTHFVKLAPFSYKEGRPLHVGDKIEWQNRACEWAYKTKIRVGFLPHLKNIVPHEWRFA